MGLGIEHTVNIYFIDHDDQFANKLAEDLEISPKYNQHIYSSGKKFLSDFQTKSDLRSGTQIIFLSTNLEIDNEGNTVEAIDLLIRVKKISKDAEVIIYSDNDDVNYVSSAFDYGMYTFVKKNENIELRIDNTIKGIISQKTFVRQKRNSFLITKIFIIFLFLILIVLFLVYIIAPQLLLF